MVDVSLKFGLGIKHFEQGVTSVSDSLLHKYVIQICLAGKIRVAPHAKIVAIDAPISPNISPSRY
jgi:hypothetical protein